MFTPDETKRYSRQIQLPEVGLQGQEKLRQAKVLIVGIGGLGCPAAQYLVAAGVGTIGLMDYDRVELSNLHRQILFTPDDIGRPKAEAAKEALFRMNAEARIDTFTEGLTPENALSVFPGYDLVMDGTDNFQSKYLINDGCVKTDKPWVYASIYKYQGQISVFNYKNGPTYRCLFTNISSKDISCEETGVIGVLPGILGTLQAAEALKIILGIGDVLSGTLKIVDTLSMQDQLIYFERDEDPIAFVKKRDLELETINCTLKNPDTMYLDVREPFEQPKPVSENIIYIPLNQLMERHAEIPKNGAVHVYCQSGIRSEKAIRLLTDNFGFTNLYNVKEGVQSILK